MDIDVVLLLVAVATMGLWLILLVALARSNKSPSVTPGAPTAELGPESPAVVDLVTGDWRLSAEAVSGTMLDLAARGQLDIESIGPDLALVRPRQGGPTIKLARYERLVYDRVMALARTGVVTTSALSEGGRKGWWPTFNRLVIAEARNLGLSAPRWKRRHATLLRATAAVPALAMAVAVSYLIYPLPLTIGLIWGALLGSAVFALLRTTLSGLNSERGTARGADVAGYWLGVREHLAGSGQFTDQPAAAVTIWGRAFAYAAALGLAGRAVAGLPITAPTDHRRAWSDYTGVWRVVEIRYPRGARGGSPLAMLIVFPIVGLVVGGVVWFVLALAIALSALPWPTWSPLLAGALVGALIAVVPVWRAIADLTGWLTFEGEVVRLHREERRSTDSDGSMGTTTWYVYYVAIDDGQHSRITAHATSLDIWQRLTEGDHIRAKVGRHLRWVQEVQVLRSARRRTVA